MTGQHLDEAKVKEFADKAFGDLSGMWTTALCYVGDRLGLFRDLHENGPAAASELAGRAGIDERYAVEWLRGMTAAGYVGHHDPTGALRAPARARAGARRGGRPGVSRRRLPGVAAILEPLESIVRAFRTGGGARQEEYGAAGGAVWSGSRTAGSRTCCYRSGSQQCRTWSARCGPGAIRGCRLRRGPRARQARPGVPGLALVGYDVFRPRSSGADPPAGGGSGRSGERREADAAKGLPERYDVITTFDVIHDAVDPLGLLRGIHRSLKDDGTYVCLDTNCADRHADNAGPVAAMLYGFSVFYCMTTSLANGARPRYVRAARGEGA